MASAEFWQDLALTVLISLPAYLLISVVTLLLLVLMKYGMVGRYREGDSPFYGKYHIKWLIMMMFKSSTAPLEQDLYGTAFYNWYLRLLGANIGEDACLFGSSLEHDLLTVGARASVGQKCDLTCHTVEHMVIKVRV